MGNDRDLQNSQEKIYKEHSKTVYRYLLSMTHDENIAEDLMQETFYQAIRCLSKYDHSCKISTWLCAIAKNQWRSYCKKYHMVKPLEEESLTEYFPSPEEMVLAGFNKIEIMKALHHLKDPQREVIYLRLSADLSFREIGEIMGHTENWARVTYYRGKEKLLEEVMKDE
ncbi:MAG: polymerase subfamily sigma factor [Lachnospiraceae bacterium]|nr:polymerase subfamily sigma factor [Lachnospiraceae bacterium]